MVGKAQAQEGVLQKLQLVSARDPGLDIDFTLLTRPDSSDQAVIEEVITKHVYRKGFRGTDYVFGVQPGERWLDLGANIGTFAVWAIRQGATVAAFEPERITHRVLQRNINLALAEGEIAEGKAVLMRYAVTSREFHEANGGRAMLSLGTAGHEWRNTLMKRKSELAAEVETLPIELAMMNLGPFDGIKADIEGAELAMFDDPSFHRALAAKPGVRKLVAEYHFDIDRSIPNFLRRMDLLRGHFDEVRYGTIPEDAPTYDWFPPSRIIYCWKNA